MKINAGEIRAGMLLEYKNDLWQVLKAQHVKPGKGGAFAQVEIKSVSKNTKLNERFRSSETIEKASLEESIFYYLYSDKNSYFFMNVKTFDQIEIKKDIIGEKGKFFTENLEVLISFYNEAPISVDLPKQIECIINKDIVGEKGKLLTENLEVNVSFYNENAISVELPNQINCKVALTDAALKGQTASSSYKPAILDNGIKIQVPPFIKPEDKIILDTRTLQYVKKI